MDDYTTFDDNNWNGWQTGSGTVPGEGNLYNDGTNIYWTGTVDMGAMDRFEPAIEKEFDIDLSRATFNVDYDFRIRKRPEGHQQFHVIATIPSFQFSVPTVVDSTTPVNQWLSARTVSTNFFVNSRKIWIGLWRPAGAIERPQWEIDFDNIRVKQRVLRRAPNAKARQR